MRIQFSRRMFQTKFQKQIFKSRKQKTNDSKQMVQTKWAARHEGPACPSAPSFIYFSLRHQSSPQGPQKQLPAAGKAPFPGRLGAFLEALLPLGSAKTQQPLRSRVISKGGETRVTWPFSPLGCTMGLHATPRPSGESPSQRGANLVAGLVYPPVVCARAVKEGQCGCRRRRGHHLKIQGSSGAALFLCLGGRDEAVAASWARRGSRIQAAAPARELCGGREVAGRPARATQTRFAARGLEGVCFVTCLFMKGKKFALLCLFFNLI